MKRGAGEGDEPGAGGGIDRLLGNEWAQPPGRQTDRLLGQGWALAPLRRYRVEHRDGGTGAVLARVEGVPAHHQTLAPFAAQLRLAAGGEAAGTLVLVDEASGRVVARRRVAPRARPPGPA